MFSGSKLIKLHIGICSVALHLDDIIIFEPPPWARRAFGLRKRPRPYWQSRERSKYMREVRRLVDEVSSNARSILDVGSNGCGNIDWWPAIPRRVSLDLETPYVAEGVESIRADFLKYEFRETFDVVLCLQVLEHIPDARAFAQKLLGVANRHLVVSVPYRWEAGKCKHHIHDPVDETKLLSWFGRPPSRARVVREGFANITGSARLVCRYDL